MGSHRLTTAMGVALATSLVAAYAHAQTLTHDWSLRAGSSGIDAGVDIAADPSGNVVAFGEFRGTIDLGHGDSIVSAGRTDLFVTKLDGAGNYVWSRRFGTTADESAGGVAIDDAGNIYITGSFQSTISFGGGPLVPAGGEDIYLVKLDAAGNHVWSMGFGDSDSEKGVDVAVDGTAYVYLTGWFRDELDLGGGPLTSVGGPDMFVAQFKTGGSHMWSHAYGDGGNDGGAGIAVDDAGDVILTGSFEGTIDFGGDPLTSQGYRDVCLLKLDLSGAHVWSSAYGSTKDDVARDVAAGPSNYLAITGGFGSTADFGGTSLPHAGSLDIFVARYDALGGHVWSQGFGGPDDDIGAAVAIDASKDIHVTGRIGSAVDFGGGVLSTAGDADIFLVELENSGTHLRSQAWGSTAPDGGESVAIDGAGNIQLIGTFHGTMNLGGDDLRNRGSHDVFVASFDASGVHRWSDGDGGAGYDQGEDLAVDGDGNVFVIGVFCGTTSLGGAELISSGRGDIFLAKYDATGSHLWSRGFPTTVPAPLPGEIPTDEGKGVATDPDGNVIITGWFKGTIELGGVPLTSVDERDIFLAKYDGAGNHLWSKSFGGPEGDRGYAVATDAVGNVYLTGSIHSPVDFGDGPLPVYGTVEMFGAAFDPSGAPIGSLSSASPGGYAAAHCMAVHPDGTVTVAGVFEGSVDLGGGPLFGVGELDVFVARWDPEGDLLWSRPLGSAGRDYVEGLGVDDDGNATVVGDFAGTGYFGGDPLVSVGFRDIFVAQYGAAGEHRWSQQFSATSIERATDLDVRPDGRIVVTGDFGGTIDFGGGELTASGGYDGYVVELDALGTYLWSESLGGPAGSEHPTGVIYEDATTFVVTGDFTGQTSFGGDDLISAGGRDMFVAQLRREVVGVGEPAAAAAVPGWRLSLARPNPFTSGTSVGLELLEGGMTSVTVVDVTGRRVRTLVSRELVAGRHEIVWDGRDASGRFVEPGVYAIHVEEPTSMATRKVIRVGGR